MASKKSASGGARMLPVLLASFIDMVGIGIIVPVLSPLIINNETGIVPEGWDMGSRNILFGVLTASFPLAQFFGAPILGALSDKYGRKPMLALSLFGSMVGYFVFAWAILTGQLWLAFAARILDGFTGGNISIVFSAIADMSDPAKRAQNFGLVGVTFGLGFILGPFIGGLLATESFGPMFGPALPFWAAGGMCAANMLLILWLFDETLKAPKEGAIKAFRSISNIARAFSMPNLRAMFTTIFLQTMGFSFFTTFFAVLMIQKFQFEEKDLGYMFGFIGICVAFVQGALIRPVSKRFPSHKVLRFSLLFLAGALVLDLLPESVTMVYLVLPLVALGQGLSAPNMNAIVSNEATPEQQGEIMGINSSIGSLGLAIPPLFAGFLSNIDYHLPVAAAALFVFLSWVTFIVLFRPSQG